MIRAYAWMCTLAVPVALAAASVAWTQENADPRAAEKAVAVADPDAVNPIEIQGEDWTLDFRFDTPEPIVVTGPDGEKQVYWYVVYTVTNCSGEDRRFVPSVLLYTDAGKTRRAGLYPKVFEAINAQRKIRFLENAVKMIGDLRQGDDNAKTGVAIFAPLDRDTDRFTLFVAGLSGQFVERTLAPAKEGDEPTTIRLRKTLALEYDLPGDKWWMNLDQPHFVSKKWTWR